MDVAEFDQRWADHLAQTGLRVATANEAQEAAWAQRKFLAWLKGGETPA